MSVLLRPRVAAAQLMLLCLAGGSAVAAATDKSSTLLAWGTVDRTTGQLVYFAGKNPNDVVTHSTYGWPVPWLSTHHVVNEARGIDRWSGRLFNRLVPPALLVTAWCLPPAVVGLCRPAGRCGGCGRGPGPASVPTCAPSPTSGWPGTRTVAANRSTSWRPA
jgi:hypothetical protein